MARARFDHPDSAEKRRRGLGFGRYSESGSGFSLDADFRGPDVIRRTVS